MTRGRRWLIIPFLVSLLIFGRLPFAGAESDFNVQCENRMLSYHANFFTVQAPEAGELVLSVQDGHHTYRQLTASVEAGDSRVEWDGLGWNGERLNSKVYQISCRLTGNSGNVYEKTFSSFVPALMMISIPEPSSLSTI